MLIWVVITMLLNLLQPRSSAFALWPPWGAAVQPPGEHRYERNSQIPPGSFLIFSSERRREIRCNPFVKTLPVTMSTARHTTTARFRLKTDKNKPIKTSYLLQTTNHSLKITSRGSHTCGKLPSEDRKAEGAVADKAEEIFLYQPSEENRGAKKADVQN